MKPPSFPTVGGGYWPEVQVCHQECKPGFSSQMDLTLPHTLYAQGGKQW